MTRSVGGRRPSDTRGPPRSYVRQRLLVIDADLPRRLATYLVARARESIHVSTLGLADNVKDPEVLRGLAGHYNGVRDWVLITGDDAMPAEHGAVIIETQATIATIHPQRPAGVPEASWYVDVTHRWAHRMQEQAPQSVRRYSFHGSEVWRPRRRHLIRIAAAGWMPWTPGPSSPPSATGQDRLPGFP